MKYKQIFSNNPDNKKTAYMNWRTKKDNPLMNMIIIANGYSKSAIMMAQNLISDNSSKEADIIIFPMLFCANHAIELYLKVMMWELNILLENEDKFEKHHNIKQLYNVVNKRLIEFEKDKDSRKEFRKLMSNLEEYINELFDTIQEESSQGKDSMDFSRYPFNNDLENHFYAESYENKVVDLENFLERFLEMHHVLDMITGIHFYEMVMSDD